MNAGNPYEAPGSSVTEPVGGECLRDGKYVYVPSGYDLPPRCIICNEAAQMPIKERTMYWHSPWLYLLIIVNILVYALIALIVRKKTKVSPGYCADHKAARQRKINWFLVPSILLMLGGTGLMVYGPDSLGVFVFVLGFLLLIPAIIASNTIRPIRIEKSGAKYNGCKEPFLSSLK